MAYGKIKADTLVYDNSGSDVEVTLSSLGNKAPLASPTFTGTPAAPTAADGVNNTQIATTAFVHSGYATKLSPTFSGTPAAPTASAGTNNTQIATTAYVDTSFAPKASPALTGTATGVNLTLSGNLTVNGTTTTINSTTLTVDDKNIELGTVDTPTDTTADGGGITLKGTTDKTFNWVNATDYWTSSEGIHILEDSAANDSPDLKISSYRPSIRFADISGSAMSSEICTDGNILRFRLSAEVDNNTALTERATLNSSGNFAATGSVSDTKGELRKIPRNDQTSNYTAVSADAGKAITANMGSGTVTINANVFAEGDALTLLNYSSTDLTIAQGSGFGLTNSADAATGNRTLAAKGMATIYFLGGTAGYISGAGLS